MPTLTGAGAAVGAENPLCGEHPAVDRQQSSRYVGGSVTGEEDQRGR